MINRNKIQSSSHALERERKHIFHFGCHSLRAEQASHDQFTDSSVVEEHFDGTRPTLSLLPHPTSDTQCRGAGALAMHGGSWLPPSVN